MTKIERSVRRLDVAFAKRPFTATAALARHHSLREAKYVGGTDGSGGAILELDRRTGRIEHEWTGLPAVVGVGVAMDGTVYVSSGDRVTKITAAPPRMSVPVGSVGSLAVDRVGNVYVVSGSSVLRGRF